MAATVLGISSSPVPESNTDRAVREILEHCELDYQFIKLSSLALEPCRACQGCTEDNSCRIHDNGRVLAEQFAQARAFVLGGYTSYGSLDSRTKIFMERMYCLRHLRSRNKGKLGISVLTTSNDADAGGLGCPGPEADRPLDAGRGNDLAGLNRDPRQVAVSALRP